MVNGINGINGFIGEISNEKISNGKQRISGDVNQQIIDALKGKKIKVVPKEEPPVVIADKNGVLRKGYLVENEPQTWVDRLQGKPEKPLAKVNEAQVTKFLNDIASLGLDIKPENVMSSNGTLNPNFKVDENGNISFRNLKAYINEKSPVYFETQAGGWAKAVEPKYMPAHIPARPISVNFPNDYIILPQKLINGELPECEPQIGRPRPDEPIEHKLY